MKNVLHIQDMHYQRFSKTVTCNLVWIKLHGFSAS